MARISGLVSGLDTDALIQELVSAYQTKQESYVKKQTKVEWTQDTWKSLNTKVYSFYTGTLRNARFSDTYNLKKATVSDSSKASVSASNNAVVGTQTLKVNQLAKTAYLTGGVVKGDKGNKLTANSKLGDLAGFGGDGESSSGIIKVSANGGEKEISVTSDMTINQFVTQLKEAGLNASFDASNQRLFVSGKNSGKDNEFSITAANEGGLATLNSLGLNAVSTSDISSYREKADMDVQMETDTAYTNYVLTQANTELNTQLSSLQDQYKYITDEAYRKQKEDSWQSSIDSYKTKNETLQENIDNILAYTGEEDAENSSAPKVGDYVTQNADGTWTYQSLYLKQKQEEDGTPVTDEDGNPIMELDEEALANALENDGAQFSVSDLKAQLAELNANVSQIESNNASVQSIEDTKKLYQDAYAGDSSGENLAQEISALKSEIDTNTKLMANTYNFAEKSDTDVINYTDIDGNSAEMTYAELKQKLNGYASASVGAGETPSQFGNGLSGSAGYQSVYDSFQTKYANEQSVAADRLQELKTQAGVTTDEDLEEAIKSGVFNQNGSGAVRVEGSDAEIILNGATYTSNTNNFSINGLTITATGKTADDEEITINTTTDIDGMYNSIKELISGYNDILKEMNTLYYADSAKGYEPLTDDEKDAMTDTEIEKWEEKIKSALLRRDDTLGSIMSAVSSSMMKTYNINGKNYSLSSFGISTAGYFSVDNEGRGLYHIAGDADDSTSKSEQDKLRSALASDPDTVIQFFQNLADDMYSTLTKKMASTSLSSSYTIYNDKQLQKQYDEYGDTIDEWDEKIETYTEKYVKQFTAMETAISKLQSSTSALSSILG